jgi:hypothetical protein
MTWHQDLSKVLGALELKELRPNYYSTLGTVIVQMEKSIQKIINAKSKAGLLPNKSNNNRKEGKQK